MTAARLRGVWATVLLDVREDGGIRLEAIDEQVRAFAAAGVDGVYVHGTASEFHCLADGQFEAVSRRFAHAARQAGLPFQIGASHPLPRQAVDRIIFASGLAPAAIQVTLPDWSPIDPPAACRYLEGCAQAAQDMPLVLYNPPHAKTVLTPQDLEKACIAVPSLIGLKCTGGDGHWYAAMRPVLERIAVFIPGHHYASGIASGAHGSYSNMACLDPAAAVAWAGLVRTDADAALDLERRIASFMADAIAPILASGLPGYACDKAMAAAGGWATITPRLLWPYSGVDGAAVERIREAAAAHIPEFAAGSGSARMTGKAG
ncbi:MAG: dihydrodipicolinate synthase family protein [Geminicoccaceae bacterium]|nr:dihydrodipicolinate synthase family protein [Geminicoccaceae bacterium]